jgi:hypothetical protein
MENGTGISKRRFRIFHVSGGIWRLVMVILVGGCSGINEGKAC